MLWHLSLHHIRWHLRLLDLRLRLRGRRSRDLIPTDGNRLSRGVWAWITLTVRCARLSELNSCRHSRGGIGILRWQGTSCHLGLWQVLRRSSGCLHALLHSLMLTSRRPVRVLLRHTWLLRNCCVSSTGCGAWLLWHACGTRVLWGCCIASTGCGAWLWWHACGTRVLWDRCVSSTGCGAWLWWHACGTRGLWDCCIASTGCGARLCWYTWSTRVLWDCCISGAGSGARLCHRCCHWRRCHWILRRLDRGDVWMLT